MHGDELWNKLRTEVEGEGTVRPGPGLKDAIMLFWSSATPREMRRDTEEFRRLTNKIVQIALCHMYS